MPPTDDAPKFCTVDRCVRDADYDCTNGRCQACCFALCDDGDDCDDADATDLLEN